MTLTPAQLHILRHSLGLDDNGHGNQYRNHYAIGPECDDFQELIQLCEMGLMHDLGRQSMWGGMHAFCVTPKGIGEVNFHYQPVKLTRSQIRYRNFLNTDNGMTFREWLKTKWAKV